MCTDAANSFYEALLIPFEISAFTLVLSYWSKTITEPGPVAGVCAAVIIIYGYCHASIPSVPLGQILTFYAVPSTS